MSLLPSGWCCFSIGAIFLKLICKASVDAASTFMCLFSLAYSRRYLFYIVL